VLLTLHGAVYFTFLRGYAENPPLPPEFSLHHQRVATAGGSLTHNGEVFVLVAPDGTVSEHRAWLSALTRLWGFARPGDGEDTATIRDAPAGATCPALEADEARAARAALEADEADEARDVHEALEADETRAVHEAWAACADAAPDELDDDPEADAWMPAPPEAAEPHAPPPPLEPPHDRNAITVAVEHALAEALHAARPRLVRIIGAVLPGRDEVDAPAAPLVGAALQDALLTRLRRWSDATLAWALNDPPPDDRPTLASSIARTDADVHLADQMGNVRRAA